MSEGIEGLRDQGTEGLGDVELGTFASSEAAGESGIVASCSISSTPPSQKAALIRVTVVGLVVRADRSLTVAALIGNASWVHPSSFIFP